MSVFFMGFFSSAMVSMQYKIDLLVTQIAFKLKCNIPHIDDLKIVIAKQCAIVFFNLSLFQG